MPNDNQKRIKRTEDFLLNPDKVIFESIEELIPAIMLLKEKFENVDFDQMDLLQGKDGKDAITPKRGVDYFTQSDLQKFEVFILRNLPKPNEDYPTIAAMEARVKELVADIPVVKGDQGARGEKGKDGSPDSPQEIIAKVRSLSKDKRWKISDVAGLIETIKRLNEVADEIPGLQEAIGNLRVVVPAASTEGGGGEGGLTTEQVQDLVGAMFTSATHSGCEVAYDDTAGTLTITVTGGGGGGLTEEEVEDVVNGLLVAGTGITLTYNDVANTLTVALTGESFTTAMKTKVDHISVTQAVNLDTMESDILSAKTKTDHITVTQAVDLDAIESRVNALDAAVILKGVWDASVGTFPGSGSAQAGESWIVSVAGTIDSVSFAVNDRIIAIVDNASTGTYAANWHKADYTDQVLSVAGKTGAVSLDAADIAETAGLKIMTSAERTKLSGIETAADVTDAANVGAVNAAATSKATPIDADSFPIVDSAASNVIKRVTFTNLKAFLKTYIDAMTSTFTNKTLISTTNTFAEVTTTASSATPTPTGGSRQNELYVTALAAGATIAAPTGSPSNGNSLLIRIKDNGTIRTLAYNAIFRAIGITLPTATVANKTIYIGCRYNSADSKWDAIAYAIEA